MLDIVYWKSKYHNTGIYLIYVSGINVKEVSLSS